jgi:putative transposase
MARLARVVIAESPHHVTQRGNRRAPTFFEDSDYILYLKWLSEAASNARTEIWAYCLMPNHVHVILTPEDEQGLRRTFADLHRRYTGFINARHGWTGHLWQGRFGSVAMDDAYLANAVRYVAMNPVRAGLVERAEDWRWSSVRAHLAGEDDGVVRVAPVLERVGDFRAFIGDDADAAAFKALRQSETTGRPLGSAGWITALERRSGRTLAPQKRGRKSRRIGKLSP